MRSLAVLRMALMLLSTAVVAAGQDVATSRASGPQAEARAEGTWSAERAEALETALDVYFAETSQQVRHHCFTSELEPAGVALAEPELVAMAAAHDPVGNARRFQTERQQLEHHPEGWFNLALPVGYTPQRAWPLVVVLHGGGGDGTSLTAALDGPLTAAGAIVLYPTITDDHHFWSHPTEMAAVYQLISWAGHHYRVDFRRLAITGVALGGMGVWSHALAHPEVWSAAAPAASRPVSDDQQSLSRLRGVPFYLLHGADDRGEDSASPLELIRGVAASMSRLGCAVQVEELPGVGHQLPPSSWAACCAWLGQQRPTSASPRPLFLPAAGERSLAEIALDPLGLAGDDPALALIRAGHPEQARTLLTQRIATAPTRLNYLYRALAEVPALTTPLDAGIAANFSAAQGWTRSGEQEALGDLQHAINADDHPSDEFLTLAYLWAAKIHAKRYLLLIDRGGDAWTAPYNACATCIRASNHADQSNRETVDLTKLVVAHLPQSLQPGGGDDGSAAAQAQLPRPPTPGL